MRDRVFPMKLVRCGLSAGAPAKRDVFSTGREFIAALNLTEHRYQEAERLTILGVDVIDWTPFAVGVAVMVVVLPHNRQ